MKLKHLISLCCCAAVMALSCLSVSAAPEDSSYLDDVYDWISSTASDLWDEYNSSDGSDSSGGYDSSSDSSDYYEEPTESYEDTSSEYYEEPTYDYYEDEPSSSYYEYEETQPQTEYVAENEDTSSEESNWYDWFTISQPETDPVTDPAIEDESTDGTSTFEYVGYGFLMWVVIIVGVIMTLAILTNTHIRKKS